MYVADLLADIGLELDDSMVSVVDPSVDVMISLATDRAGTLAAHVTLFFVLC